MSTTAYKALIIHALRLDLDDETATPREAVEHLRERFSDEYGWRVGQVGRDKAIQDWLQGLALHVPFSNYAIYQWAHAHNQKGCETEPEATDNDTICEHADAYWNLLSTASGLLLSWLGRWEGEENSEVDPYDYVDQYEDMLDDRGPVQVCGMEYSASQVLKTVDETAYRCGLLDYVDGLDVKPDVSEYEEEAEELEQAADEQADYFEEKAGDQ